MLRIIVIILIFLTVQPLWSVNCRVVVSKKSIPKVTSKNFTQHIRYLDYEGHSIPYIDVKPKRRKPKKTIFLVAGFSKNMRSWLPHIQALLKNGYRVITYDRSNTGYNLLANGVVDLKFGEGISFDAQLGSEILGHSKVSEGLIIIGHSRGAAVAAEIALYAAKNSGLERLDLDFPYVEYIWFTGNPVVESMINMQMSMAPSTFGRRLHEPDRIKSFENIPDLAEGLIIEGLGYNLKGTKPQRGEVTTVDKVKSLLQNYPEVKVFVRGGSRDTSLAPAETVKKLSFNDVDLKILEGETFDHYWPLDHPILYLREKGLIK